MRRLAIITLLAAALLASACAAPRAERAPSRATLEERVELTQRLVDIHQQHLDYVKAQHANGVAPVSDVSAAEIGLIDAKLRHLAARALLEMEER